MEEADARRVLLLRAVEEAGPGLAWREADAEWASEQARRDVGESATAEAFLAARARHGCRRLLEREPALSAWLPADGAARRPGAWAWVALLGAFVLGLIADSLGAGQRINILAPPLLGLLVWNLGLYGALMWRVALPRADAGPGPLHRALATAASQWARWTGGHAPSPAGSAPAGAAWQAAASAAAAWVALTRPLQSARMATWLHAAAAALAGGAISSLYLRGLVFEYLAGWSSTFLGPEGVHDLLAVVLGPAAAVTGLGLPGPAELAALKFSAGPGENAARWIHLYAVTLLGFVVLPRAALALVARLRARRLAAQVVLPVNEPYFQRLRRAHAGHRLVIRVQPFNYQLAESAQPALHQALDQHFGPGVQMQVAGNVPLGAPAPGVAGMRDGEWLAVLFSLSATPERETHGAFVQAVAAATPRGALVVLVDESGYRQRLSAADAATRLPQRRAAWQALLEETGHAPYFVDLQARINP